MTRTPCLRTLDRPITIFGLEPEDLVAVAVVTSVLMFAVDPLPGLVTGAVLWIALLRLKGSKAPGHLYALAYRTGLLSIAPAILRVPHLVRAPLPGKVRVVRLSAFPGPADEETPAFRHYHHDDERPRLS